MAEVKGKGLSTGKHTDDAAVLRTLEDDTDLIEIFEDKDGVTARLSSKGRVFVMDNPRMKFGPSRTVLWWIEKFAVPVLCALIGAAVGSTCVKKQAYHEPGELNRESGVYQDRDQADNLLPVSAEPVQELADFFQHDETFSGKVVKSFKM